MKLITIIISTFLILTPFVQAQGFGETVYDTLRDISKMTSILIIDFVYSLRLGILKIKDHLLTDQTDEIIKTKAYWQWELDNLRTEGKCCKSADCILGTSDVCTTVCNDCSEVKNNLDNIFK